MFDRPAEVERWLAKGFDPNSPSEKGVPALISAIQSRAVKSARVLIKHPATQVEITNHNGENALMLAALNNDLDLVQALLEREAEVNRPGWTALHYAASRGHRGVMRLLLENDAYIDAESPNGMTPLMMAAYLADPLSVKLLLEEGADPTLVNRGGQSALDLARLANQARSVAYLEAFTESWSIQNPLAEDDAPDRSK